MSDPATTSPRRFGWYACRFIGVGGGPAYVDLLEVAAVTEARDENQIIPGARVVMKSGFALYTRDSADAVWLEVHRARTQEPPPAPKNKFDGSAPAADLLAAETAPGPES